MDAYSHHGAGIDRSTPDAPAGRRDLDALGWDFRRVYPVDRAPCFGELLDAIDRAQAATVSLRSARPGPAGR